MNTEELEKSLRAEFEGQMNSALEKMRSDVADLQKNYESEFEKHRSQMDEAFRALSERLNSPFEFDQAFDESVVEHLRLARDEGAQITATAMGEAEKLGNDGSRQDIENLRNAINEIKANSTQASILRALVEAAGNFAPRGAFFIVKNDHLVGWKLFGKGELVDEDVARGIHFPVSSETLVSNAVSSLVNVEGSYADQSENAKFLGPLSFGAPSKMYAIPLCARGRGVAVLYADGGEAEDAVNIEALETLVSVAGLRVELLASAVAAQVAETTSEPAADVPDQNEPEIAEVAAEEVPEAAIEEPVEEPSVEEAGEPETEEVEAAEARSDEAEYAGDVEVAQAEVEPEAVSDVEVVDVTEVAEVAEVEEPPVVQAEVETSEPTDFAFSSNNFSEEAQVVEAESYEELVEVEAEPVADMQGEPEPVKSYRERTIDLPIEVSDDERRPHSDARRFARLLISEIRLYNEQKVIEGRESGDIYELLREAIDRSREMYEKRVQPDVSAKFDYFHYELVNSLAEGDEEKLGVGYFAVKA